MYLAEYFITFGFGQHMGELRLSLANHYTSIWAVDELTTREILWGAREDKFSTVYSSEEEAGVDRFSLIYLPLDQLEPQIGSTN